jgi:gamma-glutamyl-gamma-aminobutyrate hydrolase PuuD
MRRPRIAITRWEDVPGEKLQWYCDRVREAGGEPVVLGPETADDFEALILTGGIDVDPARYGDERHPKVRHVDPRRDQFEISVLQAALSQDLPVLAICRGHQLLNVAMGGSLVQHIEGDHHRAHREGEMPSRWHDVQIEPASRLHDVYVHDTIAVNSRHHQAVLPSMLAPDLHPVAYAPDGVIEAVEAAGFSWVIGVQWHPERLESERAGFAQMNAGLFTALIKAAQRVEELV